MQVWIWRPNPDESETLLAFTKFRNGTKEKALAFLRKHSAGPTCYAEIRVDGLKDYIGGTNQIYSSEWGFVKNKLVAWKNERF